MDAQKIKREIEKLKAEGNTSYENCEKLIQLEKAYEYLCGREEKHNMPNVYVTAYDNTYNANGTSVRPMTRQAAQDWVSHMENADGSQGGHWAMEQTEQVRTQRGFDCDPLQFWVAMNMMYSDYCTAAKKNGANNLDFYADMAKAFLDDRDAKPEKLEWYRKYVANSGWNSGAVSRSGSSEFLEIVSGKDQTAAWAVMNEHMRRMREVNPKVYHALIEKLREL